MDPLVTKRMSEVSEVAQCKVCLERPYDQFWFCANNRFLEKDQYFEMYLRNRADSALIFVDWRNIEVHAIPAWQRERIFAMPNWWSHLEQIRHLIVPSPPVVTYYSNYARSEGCGRKEIMPIEVGELVVITTI